VVTTVNTGIAVTAGIEQTRVSTTEVRRSDYAQVVDKASSIPSRATVAADNINNRAADNVVEQPQVSVSSESVRISSSIGRGDIRGNLSQAQAIEIYETIAKLL